MPAKKYTVDNDAIVFVRATDSAGNPIDFPGGGGGSSGGSGISGTPTGYQQILAATLASATALTVPGTSNQAYIQAEGGDLRWRVDGSNPTNAAGMLIAAGQSQLFVGNLAALKLIRATGQTGALANVSYFQ